MTLTLEHPSIYSLFKSNYEETLEQDRKKLSDKVFESIAPEDYEYYLRQALSRLVHTDMAQLLNQAVKAVSVANKEAKKEPKPFGGKILSVTPTQFVSSKQDDALARRKAFFASSIPTENGVAVMVGKATYEQLVFRSIALADLADATKTNADKFAKYAEAVKMHDVKSLEELPSSVLDALDI